MGRRNRLLTAIPAVGLILLSSRVGTAATLPPAPTLPPTRQEAAQQLLNSPAARYMTSSALTALRLVAGVSDQPDVGAGLDDLLASGSTAAGVRTLGAAPSGTGLTNLRVNDPLEDSHQTDATTQSETSLAVAGPNVAVGFNDSHNFIFLTAATDLSGFAYSSDGGQTFTDGGVLPNAPGFTNFGDPWLTSGADGTMYYSTLSFDWARFRMVVGVARSVDGGKTWSRPLNVAAAVEPGHYSYFADKNAMTARGGALYVSWDDFVLDLNPYNFTSGVSVARSADGGTTWKQSYAAQIYIGKGFYIGTQPLVGPDGTVYVAAEFYDFVNNNIKMVIFASRDGGATWVQGGSVVVTSSTQGTGAFELSQGRLMRNREFPTLAFFNGALYMAWNDGGDPSGHSHIRLGRSTDGGQTWTTTWVTSGTDAEAQPAISSDAGGLHLLYYEISRDAGGNGQLDMMASNSTDGITWTARRVSTESFPGSLSAPQFDPGIAPAYMGDYISNVSDGKHQYFAWGDNRDIVTNWLWPQGRPDPDVFFARQ